MADPWNGLERLPRNGRLLPGKPCFQREHNAAGSPQLTDGQERKTPPLVAHLDYERQ